MKQVKANTEQHTAGKVIPAEMRLRVEHHEGHALGPLTVQHPTRRLVMDVDDFGL